ncbi:MAG: MOSC N-terminal beta barrel domain-containing protein [Streptosporangiaceae bacterium]
MPVTVSQLAIAPVKGMRLHCTSEIRLGQYGVTGDREFLVIGEDGELLLTSRNPALLQIEPAWDRPRDVLTLRFPDGTVVQDTPGPGAPAATRMYDGREIPGRIIPGAAQRCAVRLPRPPGAPVQAGARAPRSR